MYIWKKKKKLRYAYVASFDQDPQSPLPVLIYNTGVKMK